MTNTAGCLKISRQLCRQTIWKVAQSVTLEKTCHYTEEPEGIWEKGDQAPAKDTRIISPTTFNPKWDRLRRPQTMSQSKRHTEAQIVLSLLTVNFRCPSTLMDTGVDTDQQLQKTPLVVQRMLKSTRRQGQLMNIESPTCDHAWMERDRNWWTLRSKIS